MLLTETVHLYGTIVNMIHLLDVFPVMMSCIYSHLVVINNKRLLLNIFSTVKTL